MQGVGRLLRCKCKPVLRRGFEKTRAAPTATPIERLARRPGTRRAVCSVLGPMSFSFQIDHVAVLSGLLAAPLHLSGSWPWNPITNSNDWARLDRHAENPVGPARAAQGSTTISPEAYLPADGEEMGFPFSLFFLCVFVPHSSLRSETRVSRPTGREDGWWLMYVSRYSYIAMYVCSNWRRKREGGG